MKIVINYNSSWRNSFLDGTNNEPLPKKGRKYIGSGKALKNPDNYLSQEITINTVMGLLNYLIGDKRKLYQARNKDFESTYYFEDIEDKVSFIDSPLISEELVYLRNFNNSNNQNSFTGAIKSKDPIFISEYSSELWGVLHLSFEELCFFIINNNKVTTKKVYDPLIVCAMFDQNSKLKTRDNEGIVNESLDILDKHFKGTLYEDKKGKIIPSMMYCSALYIQLERLAVHYDLSSVLTKNGLISGVSKRGFTLKNFMKTYTTGEDKKVWGNPYVMKQKVKGQGDVKSMLNKADGTLEINIDITNEKAIELNGMVENAGQSSFYVGKKGLAYVDRIKL